MVRVNWNVRRKIWKGDRDRESEGGGKEKEGLWILGRNLKICHFCSDKAGYSKPPLPQALLRQFGQTVEEKFVT